MLFRSEGQSFSVRERVDAVDGLLRADTLTRYQAHQIALNAGFLTTAEVREIENRPTIEDSMNALEQPTDYAGEELEA